MNRVLFYKHFNIFNRINQNVVDLFSDFFLVDIKNTSHLKSPLRKSSIICQCTSQISGSDNNYIIIMFESQYFPNFIMKITYIISISLLSKPTKIIKILPDLGSRYIHFLLNSCDEIRSIPFSSNSLRYL